MTSRPPFIPITDREQLGWQRRAAGVLGELLARAHREGLPVVAWWVSNAGARLIAECLAHGPARRRSDFDAWCQALGATERPEVRSGLTTRLYAEARHYDGLVIAVVATLFHDDEDQAVVASGTKPTGPGGEDR